MENYELVSTTIRLDKGLLIKVDALAFKMKISRSALIRLAIIEFILNHDKDRRLFTKKELDRLMKCMGVDYERKG